MNPDQTVMGYVPCPDCGERIPVGMSTRTDTDAATGEKVLVITPTLFDVHAHAWTHGVSGPDS